MSSITKSDLVNILQNYPDDAEVIMLIRTKQNGETKESIAMINGVGYDDLWNEIQLMN